MLKYTKRITMIYFVRHGRTDDNNHNILTGWNDVPLNSVGIEQASQAAQKLKNIKFDICFCSPLLRTKQTLQQILQYHPNLKVVYDDRLKERTFGEKDGSRVEDLPFDRWDPNHPQIFKGFESVQEVYNRIKDFWDYIKLNYPQKNILVVSHSGIGRVSNVYFNGLPQNGSYTDFQVKNGGIAEFEN